MTELKNDQEEIIEDLPEVEEGQDDTTDWKALALKNQGIAKRLKTKLDKKEETKEVEEPKAKPKKKKSPIKKQEGFDYGQLAYLETKGITNEKDQDYLLQEIESTGKELKAVLEFNYVKEALEGFKEDRTSTDAIPDGTQRSEQTSRDKVDYWIAKGEMPPADQTQLRREYVNAKLKRDADVSKFTDRPVVQ